MATGNPTAAKAKAEAARKKRKRKGLFSKYLIAFIIIVNILFTLKVLDVFERTAAEPATLITAWFAFTTGELWMLASIKKKKVKNDTDNAPGEPENGDLGDFNC